MIEVKGREELERRLRPETTKQPIVEGIKKITVWLQSNIQRSTPVDTGRLRSSLTQKVEEYEGRIGTNVEYAPFVEYGHSQEVGRFVGAIGKRLVAPWVPPSRVLHGSSQRVRDMGPFTFTLQEAKGNINDWLKEIGMNIQQRFG